VFTIDTQLMSSYLVPFYFIHITFGLAVLAWWFSANKKNAVLKWFGAGFIGYAIAVGIWTAVIITQPMDLEPYILLGAIPFLLAHLAFAWSVRKQSKSMLVWYLTLILVVATLVARIIYPSTPYFSQQGYFFFGLQPIPLALYIATISVSLLPAIRAAVSQIKNKPMAQVMNVGLMMAYIAIIVQITAMDDIVRLLNGMVASVALLVMWVKCFMVRPATK
jgi:hypothetical protein